MIDVSILVITYNQKDFVRETIESCLNQTFDSSRYEIIVSDDGSTDGTQEIIQEYADKYANIVPILHEVNTGIASNLNRGLEKAQGTYLAFLGGDDIMLPDKLNVQVDYFKNNQDVIGCSHDMEVFDSKSNQKIANSSQMLSSKKIPDKMGVEFLFDSAIALIPSAMMIKRQYIPEHGFDSRLKYANDYLFDIECFAQGELGFIHEVYGRYRKHEQQVSSLQKKENDFEEYLIVLGIVLAKYPKLYKIIYRHQASKILSHIIYAIQTDQKDRARFLSKYLILNGHYLKGIFGYMLNIFLNKKIIDSIYNSKNIVTIKKIWRKYIV